MFKRSFLIITLLVLTLVSFYSVREKKSSLKPERKNEVVSESFTAKPLLMSPVLEKTSPVFQASDVMPELKYEEELPVIDEAWEGPLLDLLIELDPHNGEKTFQHYIEEKKRYQEDLNLNLLVQLDSLSSLNGESLDEFQKEKIEEGPVPVMMLELNHRRRVKEIFGEHYLDIIHRYEMDYQ